MAYLQNKISEIEYETLSKADIAEKYNTQATKKVNQLINNMKANLKLYKREAWEMLEELDYEDRLYDVYDGIYNFFHEVIVLVDASLDDWDY